MSARTMTRRGQRQTPAKDRPVYDLGGRTVPHGSLLQIAAAPRPTDPTKTDPAFSGTLIGVDYRDGVAYTVAVWTPDGSRHVHATRVAKITEPVPEPDDDEETES